VHRDLKLANILIKEGKAIIADFGFAKKNMY
jgi:serine/threonine protein kinase